MMQIREPLQYMEKSPTIFGVQQLILIYTSLIYSNVFCVSLPSGNIYLDCRWCFDFSHYILCGYCRSVDIFISGSDATQHRRVVMVRIIKPDCPYLDVSCIWDRYLCYRIAVVSVSVCTFNSVNVDPRVKRVDCISTLFLPSTLSVFRDAEPSLKLTILLS